MSEDEKELIDQFRKLTPGNRAIAQSNLCLALAIQENSKKAMSVPAQKAGKGSLQSA